MKLQDKILTAFQGMVVRKDLAFLVKGGLPASESDGLEIAISNHNHLE